MAIVSPSNQFYVSSLFNHALDRLMDKFARRELDFYFSRTNCARYLYILTARVLWPGGVWDDAEEKRTEADKEKTRAELLKWMEVRDAIFRKPEEIAGV